MGISPSRRPISSAVTVALAACAVAATVSPALAAVAGGPTGGGGKPTVVLIHGAFADASGWNDVAERLTADGYPVVAPPNELRGVANDAAYVASVLKSISGPIVLAGHSYGGAVISQAAAGIANVKALVYLAALMPDVGESPAELSAKFAGSELGTALNPVPYTEHGGSGTDLYLKNDKFRDIFAADLPEAQTRTMATEQRPLAQAGFGEKLTAAAWHDIPSWFLVSRQDKAIAPELERFEAKRGKSHTVEIDSSHVAMMSHPDVVAQLIREAAGGAGAGGGGGTAAAELAATGSHGRAVALVGAAGAAALLTGAALTRIARRRSTR
ncbi:alpha/beta fold hydrolase [Kitasatospora sp. NPDC094011]|uniref:alpha/beta fold hydrolase n=1 Tax=Kitasatospora sp. NPDC094011 TaxID=3364090 RepID=UPI00382DF62C